MSLDGKHETLTALSDDWGIINDKKLVARAVKRWIVSGVMPKKQEMLDEDPIWETDLLNARMAVTFLKDAAGVAEELRGALSVGG